MDNEIRMTSRADGVIDVRQFNIPPGAPAYPTKYGIRSSRAKWRAIAKQILEVCAIEEKTGSD